MVVVDMPLPPYCALCPMSYWVRTGPHEGQLICEAIEFRDKVEAGECLVDESQRKRPDNCPIRE